MAGVLRAPIEGLSEEFADDADYEEQELALTESASELFSHVGRDDLAALDDLIAAADQLSRRGVAKVARSSTGWSPNCTLAGSGATGA